MSGISYDNQGRRIEIERRRFSYLIHIPERRTGLDRRSGKDRRINKRTENDKDKKRKSIILVDKSADIRKTLRSILEMHQDFEVIAEAADLGLIKDIMKKSVADIIIIDLNVSEINSILTIKKSKRFRPDIPVIVLSLQANLRYLQACIRAGASGYVLLESALDELPNAVRNVISGNIYISKKLNS